MTPVTVVLIISSTVMYVQYMYNTGVLTRVSIHNPHSRRLYWGTWNIDNMSPLMDTLPAMEWFYNKKGISQYFFVISLGSCIETYRYIFPHFNFYAHCTQTVFSYCTEWDLFSSPFLTHQVLWCDFLDGASLDTASRAIHSLSLSNVTARELDLCLFKKVCMSLVFSFV